MPALHTREGEAMSTREQQSAAKPDLPDWMVDETLPDDPADLLRMQLKTMHAQTRLFEDLLKEHHRFSQEQRALAEQQRILAGQQRTLAEQQLKALRGIKGSTDIWLILMILGVLAAIGSCVLGGGFLSWPR